jgi:hypothetical protein
MIIISIVVVGFPAQWIFNLFLQLNPKNKLLITIKDAIIGNYSSGLTMSILFSIYSSLLFNNTPDRTKAMIIVGTIGGILTSIATFLPLNNRPNLSQQSLSLLLGYQVALVILGVINLSLCLRFNDPGIFGYLFAFLGLSSFLVAIRISEK